jgi:putative transposase
MCELLEVSESGYWAWCKRPPSDRELGDAWLTEQIRRIHKASGGRYGSPRVHAMLAREGIRVGEKRVERPMRLAGLQGAHRRRKGCTIRVPGVEPFADLVGRDFRPTAPNLVWAADIKQIKTGEGWLYLAAVQDLFSRRIVGWAMAAHMRQELVVDALTMAVRARKPAKGTIHHSDHGGQFIGLTFGQTCHDAGIAQSMGAVGTCYDNAVAETFFATLTKERLCTTRRPAAGQPALSCARRSSSTSRGSTTRSGCTARSGCAPPSSTRRITPPAIPTASRAPAHTRTRAKKLLTTCGCQQLLRHRPPDSMKPGEVQSTPNVGAGDAFCRRTDRRQLSRDSRASTGSSGIDGAAWIGFVPIQSRWCRSRNKLGASNAIVGRPRSRERPVIGSGYCEQPAAVARARQERYVQWRERHRRRFDTIKFALRLNNGGHAVAARRLRFLVAAPAAQPGCGIVWPVVPSTRKS